MFFETPKYSAKFIIFVAVKLAQIAKSLIDGSRRTRLALRVAMWGVAISVAVVTISQLIVVGFRSTIEEKLTAIISYAHITDNNPIFVTSDMMELNADQLLAINQTIAPQMAEAVVEASVVAQYDANTVGLLLVGAASDTIAPDAIRISRTTARLLSVQKGSLIDITTFLDQPRRQTLRVDSIYSSDITDVETALGFASIETTRRLALIDTGYVSYYKIEHAAPLEPLLEVADNEGLKVMTAEQRVPHIYSWLSMIDQNMTLILIIMSIVAIINVVTATLIAIVDNMQKIATLRALGMRSSAVRRLFLLAMGRYVARGAVVGLSVGLALGALQYFTGVVTLDSASYFVSQIPIGFDFVALAAYVVIVAIVVTLSILLPISIISKLSIASTIKYE